jgi:hypothetical protein
MARVDLLFDGGRVNIELQMAWKESVEMSWDRREGLQFLNLLWDLLAPMFANSCRVSLL